MSAGVCPSSSSSGETTSYKLDKRSVDWYTMLNYVHSEFSVSTKKLELLDGAHNAAKM